MIGHLLTSLQTPKQPLADTELYKKWFARFASVTNNANHSLANILPDF